MGVLLVAGVLSGCASAARPAAADRSAVGVAPAAQASSMPGVDPAIQRWFLGNGAVKVAFNNALLRAERGVATGVPAECRPLSAATQILNKALPKLATLSPAGQQLATAIQPALTTFGAAAAACLARDFNTATTSLNVGIGQQADGQAAVDEILDGDR